MVIAFIKKRVSHVQGGIFSGNDDPDVLLWEVIFKASTTYRGIYYYSHQNIQPKVVY